MADSFVEASSEKLTVRKIDLEGGPKYISYASGTTLIPVNFCGSRYRGDALHSSPGPNPGNSCTR
jgi:hypothetical protein